MDSIFTHEKSKKLRLQLSVSEKAKEIVNKAESFPGDCWRMFCHNPHGKDNVYLLVYNSDETKCAVLHVNKTTMKQMLDYFHKMDWLREILGS